MSIVEIRSALQSQLLKVSDPLPTAWEDSRFRPDSGVPWQKVHLLPNEPLNPTICNGSGELVYEHGIFQVSLYFPRFSGPNRSARKAEEIRSVFKRGVVLSEGAVSIRVEKTPTISPSFVEGGWTVTPVSIRYYSYVRTT